MDNRVFISAQTRLMRQAMRRKDKYQDLGYFFRLERLRIR